MSKTPLPSLWAFLFFAFTLQSTAANIGMLWCLILSHEIPLPVYLRCGATGGWMLMLLFLVMLRSKAREKKTAGSKEEAPVE
jgi:hypothetical protein